MTRGEQLAVSKLRSSWCREIPRLGGRQAHLLALLCCAGPSIGRAGRPHRPPCSPQWHLSREGAVSQDPPHGHRLPACSTATSPHPGAGSLRRANRGPDSPHRCLAQILATSPFLFPSSLSSSWSPNYGQRRRHGERTERVRRWLSVAEDQGLAGTRTPLPSVKGGRGASAEAVGAPSRSWVSRDKLRPAFCGGVRLPTLKQPDGGGDDGNNKSNAKETLPGQVAPSSGSPPPLPRS